jgi:hypothetical protein
VVLQVVDGRFALITMQRPLSLRGMKEKAEEFQQSGAEIYR